MIDEVDKISNNLIFLKFLGMLRDKYLRRNAGDDHSFQSVSCYGILAQIASIKNFYLTPMPLLILLLFATLAYSQQMRVAVMPTVDDADSIQYMDLNFLTGKLRDIAGKTLPKAQYGIMTQESIVDRMGSQERAEKECREASCLADLGRKISAAYIAQGRIGRFSGMLTLKVELYNSKSGNLVGTINETSKDLFNLASILDNKAPDLFKEILEENIAISPPKPLAPKVIISNGVFVDARDGKKYKTAKIGDQTWIAENLNYNVNSSVCYENKPANCAKYGRLYSWVAAKNACPLGWHLPSKSEYEILDKAVGGEKAAGKKLKAESGWNSDGNGTDEFKFSALPGGGGYSGKSFFGVGGYGRWWSASEGSSYYAYYRYMYYSNEYVYWDSGAKSSLFSVRCLLD